jgi:hypothetical protein
MIRMRNKKHKNIKPLLDETAIRITISGASSFERSRMTYIIKEILNKEGFDTKFIYGVDHGTDEIAFDDAMSDDIGSAYQKIINENVIEIIEKGEKQQMVPVGNNKTMCFKFNDSPASHKALRLINSIKGNDPYIGRSGDYYGLLNGLPFVWLYHETVMMGSPKVLPAVHILPLLEQIEQK